MGADNEMKVMMSETVIIPINDTQTMPQSKEYYNEYHARWMWVKSHEDPEFYKRRLESHKKWWEKAKQSPEYMEHHRKLARENARRYRIENPEYRKRQIESGKRWKRNHPDQARSLKEKSRKKRTVELKLQVLGHYSNGTMKCSLCGYDEVSALTIDHIKGGGNKHRKQVGTGLRFYYWIIRNHFPSGFRTLCMNCQFVTMYGDK